MNKSCRVNPHIFILGSGRVFGQQRKSTSIDCRLRFWFKLYSDIETAIKLQA